MSLPPLGVSLALLGVSPLGASLAPLGVSLAPLRAPLAPLCQPGIFGAPGSSAAHFHRSGQLLTAHCSLPTAHCLLRHFSVVSLPGRGTTDVEGAPSLPALISLHALISPQALISLRALISLHLAPPPYLAIPLARRARPMPAGRGSGWHCGALAGGGAAVARRSARRQGVPRPLDTSTTLY